MIKASGYKKVLVIVAILLAIIGTFAGYMGKPHASYTSLILTPLFLCFAFLEHIAEFKAGKSGFEAKTRRLISDAESAVDGVHSLALLNAKIMLDVLSDKMGWGDHYLPEEVEKLKEETVKVLREMGIPNKVIKAEALSGWYQNIIMFYRHNLTSYWVAAREEVQSEMKKLNKVEDSELPAALRGVYSKLEVTDREEFVADLEYLIANREHRRPEKWLEIRKISCLK